MWCLEAPASPIQLTRAVADAAAADGGAGRDARALLGDAAARRGAGLARGRARATVGAVGAFTRASDCRGRDDERLRGVAWRRGAPRARERAGGVRGVRRDGSRRHCAAAETKEEKRIVGRFGKNNRRRYPKERLRGVDGSRKRSRPGNARSRSSRRAATSAPASPRSPRSRGDRAGGNVPARGVVDQVLLQPARVVRTPRRRRWGRRRGRDCFSKKRRRGGGRAEGAAARGTAAGGARRSWTISLRRRSLKGPHLKRPPDAETFEAGLPSSRRDSRRTAGRARRAAAPGRAKRSAG